MASKECANQNNNGTSLQAMCNIGEAQPSQSVRFINGRKNGKGDGASVQGHFMSEVRIREDFEPNQEEIPDGSGGTDSATTCMGWADLVSRGYCPQGQLFGSRCPTCTSPSCSTCRGDCAEHRPDGYPALKEPQDPEPRRPCRLKCSCPEDHCTLYPPEDCASKPRPPRWPCVRCRDPTRLPSRTLLFPTCCQPPRQKSEHFPEHTPQSLHVLRNIRGPESSRPILSQDLRRTAGGNSRVMPCCSEPCFPITYPCSPCSPCTPCLPCFPLNEEVSTTRTKYYKQPTACCAKYPNCDLACQYVMDCCPQLIGEEEVCTVRRNLPRQPCYPPCGPCGPCPTPCAPCGPCGPCPSPFAPCGPCGPCPSPCAPCGPCGPCPSPCAPCGPCGPCPSPCAPCGPCPSPCSPCGPCGPCPSPCAPCVPCPSPCYTPCGPCPPCSAPCSPCPPCSAPCSPCPSPCPSPPCPSPTKSPPPCSSPRTSSSQTQFPFPRQQFPCSLPVPCEQFQVPPCQRAQEKDQTISIRLPTVTQPSEFLLQAPPDISTSTLESPADATYDIVQRTYDLMDRTRDISPHTPIQPQIQYYTPPRGPPTPPYLASPQPPSSFTLASPIRDDTISPFTLPPVDYDPNVVLPPHEGSYMAQFPHPIPSRYPGRDYSSILPYPASISLPVPSPQERVYPERDYPYTISQVPYETPQPQVSTPIAPRVPPPLRFRSPLTTPQWPGYTPREADTTVSPVIRPRGYISTSTPSTPSPVIRPRGFISTSTPSTPSPAIQPRGYISTSTPSTPSPAIQPRGYISTSTPSTPSPAIQPRGYISTSTPSTPSPAIRPRGYISTSTPSTPSPAIQPRGYISTSTPSTPSPAIQPRGYISTSTPSTPSPAIQPRGYISTSTPSTPSPAIQPRGYISTSTPSTPSPVIQPRGYISTSTPSTPSPVIQQRGVIGASTPSTPLPSRQSFSPYEYPVSPTTPSVLPSSRSPLGTRSIPRPLARRLFTEDESISQTPRQDLSLSRQATMASSTRSSAPTSWPQFSDSPYDYPVSPTTPAALPSSRSPLGTQTISRPVARRLFTEDESISQTPRQDMSLSRRATMAQSTRSSATESSPQFSDSLEPRRTSPQAAALSPRTPPRAAALTHTVQQDSKTPEISQFRFGSNIITPDSAHVYPFIKRPAGTPPMSSTPLGAVTPKAARQLGATDSPYFSDSFYTAKPESPQLPFRVAPVQFRTPDSALASPYIKRPSFEPPKMSTPIQADQRATSTPVRGFTPEPPSFRYSPSQPSPIFSPATPASKPRRFLDLSASPMLSTTKDDSFKPLDTISYGTITHLSPTPSLQRQFPQTSFQSPASKVPPIPASPSSRKAVSFKPLPLEEYTKSTIMPDDMLSYGNISQLSPTPSRPRSPVIQAMQKTPLPGPSTRITPMQATQTTPSTPISKRGFQGDMFRGTPEDKAWLASDNGGPSTSATSPVARREWQTLQGTPKPGGQIPSAFRYTHKNPDLHKSQPVDPNSPYPVMWLYPLLGAAPPGSTSADLPPLDGPESFTLNYPFDPDITIPWATEEERKETCPGKKNDK